MPVNTMTLEDLRTVSSKRGRSINEVLITASLADRVKKIRPLHGGYPIKRRFRPQP